MLLSSSKRAFSSTSTATCLPFLDGLQQRLDDRRVAAHAVEGHLDGQHVRVAGRLAKKLHHRLERLEGVVQQDVVAADEGENVLFGVGLQLGGDVRDRRACPLDPADRGHKVP